MDTQPQSPDLKALYLSAAAAIANQNLQNVSLASLQMLDSRIDIAAAVAILQWLEQDGVVHPGPADKTHTVKASQENIQVLAEYGVSRRDGVELLADEPLGHIEFGEGISETIPEPEIEEAPVVMPAMFAPVGDEEAQTDKDQTPPVIAPADTAAAAEVVAADQQRVDAPAQPIDDGLFGPIGTKKKTKTNSKIGQLANWVMKSVASGGKTAAANMRQAAQDLLSRRSSPVRKANEYFRDWNVAQTSAGALAKHLEIGRQEAADLLKEMEKRGFVSPANGPMWNVNQDKIKPWMEHFASDKPKQAKAAPHPSIAATVGYFLSLSTDGKFYQDASHETKKLSNIHLRSSPMMEDFAHVATVTDRAVIVHNVGGKDIFLQSTVDGLRTALARWDGNIKVSGINKAAVAEILYTLDQAGVVFNDLQGKPLKQIKVNGREVHLRGMASTPPQAAPTRPVEPANLAPEPEALVA